MPARSEGFDSDKLQYLPANDQRAAIGDSFPLLQNHPLLDDGQFLSVFVSHIADAENRQILEKLLAVRLDGKDMFLFHLALGKLIPQKIGDPLTELLYLFEDVCDGSLGVSPAQLKMFLNVFNSAPQSRH